VTLLARVVETSLKVGATAGRLAKVRELATCLRALAPDEIDIGVQYLAGETRQGRFGLRYAALSSASTGAAAPEPTLSLVEVDRRFAELATIRGTGVTTRRSAALNSLFALATESERQFLIRLLVGELRQGALGGVMIDAIAAAAELPAADVRRAAMYAKSLGEVARAALLEGAAALARFQLEMLSPVAPMLAQTAADPAAALTQLGGEVEFEWKMDGARIQVHKAGDTVRIYTRALNEVTNAVPEIVETIQKLAAREVVLDGEAIAFNTSGRPQPFQVTMRRFGRKLNVEDARRIADPRLLLRLPATRCAESRGPPGARTLRGTRAGRARFNEGAAAHHLFHE